MTAKRFSRRGYTLFTILTILIVLGAFSLIASRAFVATMTVNARTAKAHTQVMRFESAMRLLRADVWNAAAMSGQDNNVLLKTFGGSAMTWIVDSDGTIVRYWHEGGRTQTRRWEMGIPGITLAVHGADVVIHVPDGRYTRETERHLINQHRVAEGLAS